MGEYITIRVSEDLKEKVRIYASKNQVPMSSIVKIALVEYISKNEKTA